MNAPSVLHESDEFVAFERVSGRDLENTKRELTLHPAPKCGIQLRKFHEVDEFDTWGFVPNHANKIEAGYESRQNFVEDLTDEWYKEHSDAKYFGEIIERCYNIIRESDIIEYENSHMGHKTSHTGNFIYDEDSDKVHIIDFERVTLMHRGFDYTYAYLLLKFRGEEIAERFADGYGRDFEDIHKTELALAVMKAAEKSCERSYVEGPASNIRYEKLDEFINNYIN